MTNRTRAAAMVFVFALTAYAFAPALGNDFVRWDDFVNFTENPSYRGLGWKQLRWMFTSTYTGPYIPLTWVSFGLDYVVWGLDPFGYHLTNVALHATSAVVVFLVAERLIHVGDATRDGDGRHSWLAPAAAALLFAVHPLRVESVAWATERRDVLCGLFFSVSVLFHLRHLDENEARRGRYRIGSLVAFGLALLAKASSVPLPFLLVVLDLYVAKRLHTERAMLSFAAIRRALVDEIPYFVMAVPIAVVAVIGQSGHSIMASASFPLSARLAVASYATVFYLAKTVWPSNLSPLYSIPIDFDPLDFRYVGCFVVVVAITVASVLYADRRPALFAAWAWYGVALAPTSGALQAGFQIAADRYTYLPSISWAFLAAGGLSILERRSRGSPVAWSAIVLATAGIIATFVVWSRAQTGVWHDSFSLWEHVLRLEADSVTGHNNLGALLAEQGRFAEALPHFEFVLRHEPQRASARYNRDVVMEEMRKR
jgi:hypothetical protein